MVERVIDLLVLTNLPPTGSEHHSDIYNANYRPFLEVDQVCEFSMISPLNDSFAEATVSGKGMYVLSALSCKHSQTPDRVSVEYTLLNPGSFLFFFVSF